MHTGSIAAVLPPGDQATRVLLAAARGHATIGYDPNCRPAISPDAAAARRQAELFVTASDIVKASDEDLCWLYPDRTAEETLDAWLELGPAVIALTRGACGARQRLQTLTVDQLHALAAYANRAAAITCSLQGADPPRSAELGPVPVPSPARSRARKR